MQTCEGSARRNRVSVVFIVCAVLTTSAFFAKKTATLLVPGTKGNNVTAPAKKAKPD